MPSVDSKNLSVYGHCPACGDALIGYATPAEVKRYTGWSKTEYEFATRCWDCGSFCLYDVTDAGEWWYTLILPLIIVMDERAHAHMGHQVALNEEATITMVVNLWAK